jgi:hypothetical protein
MIEVRSVTADGRALKAQFEFAAALEDARYVFYSWRDNHYVRFKPPPIGASSTLPAAQLTLSL